MSSFLVALSALLVSLLTPTTAFAGYGLITDTVNDVGFSLPTLMGAPCSGPGCGFIAIMLHIIARFRPLVTVVGALVICIFGIRMMIAQEDDAITKARTVMTGIVSGLVLVWLIEPFVSAFYGSQGEHFQGDIGGTLTIAGTEIGGLINWALALVAVLAIFMIALSCFKALFKPDSEESIKNIRTTVTGVLAGILLLAFHQFIAVNFIGSTQNPIPVLGAAVSIVAFLLMFLALAALLVLIYAGINVVLSMGKDDAWTKAKALLGRAALGFIAILASLTLVRFIILPAVS